jgi:hypothetical protein
MNTLQEYYDFTDKDVFDCKSKFGLHNVIKESCNVLLQNKAFKKSNIYPTTWRFKTDEILCNKKVHTISKIWIYFVTKL